MTGTTRPQFSEQEYMAVIALEGNEHFKVLADFLAKRAIHTAVVSIETLGDEGRWLQGRSQELKDLTNIIKNARKHLEANRRVGRK